jgi:hypothetical protein
MELLTLAPGLPALSKAQYLRQARTSGPAAFARTAEAARARRARVEHAPQVLTHVRARAEGSIHHGAAAALADRHDLHRNGPEILAY